MTIELMEEHQCFGGVQQVYSHQSEVTHCTMRFGLFLPPQAQKQRVPVLYWLSGLSCTEQNFITKAGAQRIAADLGIAIVAPDTSPRGVNLPGDQAYYYFGVGAGFYLDATQPPWSKYYNMSRYIHEELPSLLQKLPLNHSACGVFGHSMGGHGALTLALKYPEQYRSVSAFSPICAPSQCSWGQKAFTGYLGPDNKLWKEYDACKLILERKWPHSYILIDQGMQDPYLKEQLKPDYLKQHAQTPMLSLTCDCMKGMTTVIILLRALSKII